MPANDRPPSTIVGLDGVRRCAWSDGSADYRSYHDEEWGRPVHGDVPLFERITLEAFQSGLSWLTILRKRNAFRSAFSGFDPHAVQAYDTADVERLMGDAGIVRNRRKIDATLQNARTLVELRLSGGEGALDALFWSFAPSDRGHRPRSLDELRSQTPESVALSKELKRVGFAFVGPTTMHAAMQACGVIDDHVRGCHRT